MEDRREEEVPIRREPFGFHYVRQMTRHGRHLRNDLVLQIVHTLECIDRSQILGVDGHVIIWFARPGDLQDPSVHPCAFITSLRIATAARREQCGIRPFHGIDGPLEVADHLFDFLGLASGMIPQRGHAQPDVRVELREAPAGRLPRRDPAQRPPHQIHIPCTPVRSGEIHGEGRLLDRILFGRDQGIQPDRILHVAGRTLRIRVCEALVEPVVLIPQSRAPAAILADDHHRIHLRPGYGARGLRFIQPPSARRGASRAQNDLIPDILLDIRPLGACEYVYETVPHPSGEDLRILDIEALAVYLETVVVSPFLQLVEACIEHDRIEIHPILSLQTQDEPLICFDISARTTITDPLLEMGSIRERESVRGRHQRYVATLIAFRLRLG